MHRVWHRFPGHARHRRTLDVGELALLRLKWSRAEAAHILRTARAMLQREEDLLAGARAQRSIDPASGQANHEATPERD